MKKAISFIIKHYIFAVAIIVFSIFMIFMTWPHRLLNSLPSDAGYRVVDLDAKPIWDNDQNVTWEETGGSYFFEPESKETNALEQILNKYSYRRTLSTFGKDGSLHGAPAGYFLSIYTGEFSLTLGGSGKIRLNDHIYQLGFWGNHQSLSLMDEVENLLDSYREKTSVKD